MLWALQRGWGVLPVTYLVDRVLESRDLLLQVVQAPASQVVSHSDCLEQKHGMGW